MFLLHLPLVICSGDSDGGGRGKHIHVEEVQITIESARGTSCGSTKVMNELVSVVT